MTGDAWVLSGGVVFAVLLTLAVIRHLRRERGVVGAVEGMVGQPVRVGVEQMVSKGVRRSYEVEGVVETVDGHAGGRAIRFAEGACIEGLDDSDAMTDSGAVVVPLADVGWIELPDGTRLSP